MLSKTKQNNIKQLLWKALKDKWPTDFIKELYERILSIIDNKQIRSLQEHRYYFGAVLPFFESNTPELLLRALDIQHLSSDAWHSLLKSKFDKVSIAFDNMDQTEFHDYIQSCLEWFASLIGCKKEDMLEEIDNVRDDNK